MLGGGASFGGTQGKADTRAAWCEGEKAISVRKSPLQGSCDFSLIECISEGLQSSEEGTHCTGFRDISIAGLGQGTGEFSGS